MKVSKLFKITGISEFLGKNLGLLDRDNCKIVDRTKNENSLVLHLKRESDGQGGQAHLRVQDQFETISAQLLNWALVSNSIIGLTLNQLDNLETDSEIEKLCEDL